MKFENIGNLTAIIDCVDRCFFTGEQVSFGVIRESDSDGYVFCPNNSVVLNTKQVGEVIAYLENNSEEKMMKTVTHKGKVYTKGHYYADDDGRVGILKSYKEVEEFPFVLYTEDVHGSTSWPCTNLVTLEGTFGTIEDAPIELKDGHVYEIEMEFDRYHVGYYRESRKAFFTELISGNKICADVEPDSIVELRRLDT